MITSIPGTDRALLILVMILQFGLCLGPGCTSTITPTPVTAERASYDGDAQTSGVLALTEAGFVVTPRWRERYNLAIARHGAEWRPALAPDHGIVARTDGTYLASREAMEKAIVMFAWIRMGKEPAK
ncbi:hypothetical protein OpiT1DRAFT_03984 [Opitutaceae bacterium TAV1]|nr:hypothetical protein OpiT1DRAFT_03984 [Opitutaceae bacterium TAV1]